MAGLLRVSIATTVGVDVFENLDCAVSWLGQSAGVKSLIESVQGVKNTVPAPGAHVGLRGVVPHTLSPGACGLIARDE